MHFWSRVISSKGTNSSIRRQNNDSCELEINTATWLLWALDGSHLVGKKCNYYTCYVIDLIDKGKLDWFYTMEVRKGISRTQ